MFAVLEQKSLKDFTLRSLDGDSHDPDPSNASIFVPAEIFSTAVDTAQVVAGNFLIEVKLGEPGGGSFCSSDPPSITLDPLVLIENPDEAIMVPAHEGGHAAIHPSPYKLKIPKSEVDKVASELGFASLRNGVLDAQVNTWIAESFPYTAKPTKDSYDRTFERGSTLSSPEVAGIRAQLGFYPRFGIYMSELLKRWHTGEFSEELPSRVRSVLRRTRGYLDQAIACIPEPQSRDVNEINGQARKTWDILAKKIWPFVKKLGELDLKVGSYKMMLDKFHHAETLLEAKREQIGVVNDPQAELDLAEEIEKLEEFLEPYRNISRETMEELSRERDREIMRQAERFERSQTLLQREIVEDAGVREELERKLSELSADNESPDQSDRGLADKEIEDASRELQLQEIRVRVKREKLEKGIESLSIDKGEPNIEATVIPDTEAIAEIIKGKMEGAGNLPLPWDYLSAGARKEIADLFQRQQESEQEQQEEEARKILEEFEDALGEPLKPKFDDQPLPTHGEQREAAALAAKQAEEDKEAEGRANAARQAREDKRRAEMSEWDKRHERLGEHVRNAYTRLRPHFVQNRNPYWELGAPVGTGRPHMPTLMQGKRDPAKKLEGWERLSVPENASYSFTIIIDCSESMGFEPPKYGAALDGAIMQIELLELLRVPYQVIAFNSPEINEDEELILGTEATLVKSFAQTMTPELKQNLCSHVLNPSGGTWEFAAIELGYAEILRNLQVFNFINIYSDGASSGPEFLAAQLKIIKKDRLAPIVCFGLGEETDFVTQYYGKNGFPNLLVEVTEGQRRAGYRPFPEVLCSTIEDMLRDPIKYFMNIGELNAAP
jgi:tetratricopeptide (TPR) repeat protein